MKVHHFCSIKNSITEQLTSREPSVGIRPWDSLVEEAGHSRGCPGAWTHTVCRTGREIGSNGGHSCPLQRDSISCTEINMQQRYLLYVYMYTGIAHFQWTHGGKGFLSQ